MIKIFEEFGFEPKKFYSTDEYKNVNENYKPNEKSHTLGLVEGKSFVLNGVSRNGRFYPKELWENVLKDTEVIQMLKEKLMFGCIGHPEEYTLDELLAEGKVSHIVTDIRLGNDGFGYATYEILDTPAGRILNTILRAGSKLKVSTRAFGDFSNEFKELDGNRYKVIDPKSFKLESIDFVIKPGIANVDVKLMEELEQKNSQDLEKLKEGEIKLCKDGVCTLIEEVEIHKEIESKFNEEVEKYKSIINTLKEENKNLQDNLIEAKEEAKKDDKKDTKKSDKETDEESEKQFIEELKKQSKKDLQELLIAEIEGYLKQIGALKNRQDVSDLILEFLESDEISVENLQKLKEKFKEVESVQLNKIKPILDVLEEKIKEDEKEKEDILKGVAGEFKEMLFKEKLQEEISKVNETHKQELKEYQNLIKDISQKLIEEKSKKKNEKSFKEKMLENTIEENSKKIKNLLKEISHLKNEKEILNKSVRQNIKELDEAKKELEKSKLKNISLKESFEVNFDAKVQKEVFEKIEAEKIKLQNEIRKSEKEKFENLLETKLKDLNFEIKTLQEKLEIQKNNFEIKAQKLEETISEKEIVIENLNTNINKLSKNSISESSIKEELENKYNKKLNKLEENVKYFQLQYLKSLYKNVDENTIKETLNNIKDIERAKKILEDKEVKLYSIPEEKIEIVSKPKESILAEKLI